MKSLDRIYKSLEERFDSKFNTINQSQINDFDREKINKRASSFFKIEFSTSIPEETKLFLKEKIPSILDFPIKFGLKTIHANYTLRFIDQDNYEAEMGKPIPKNIKLPASSLKLNSLKKEYKITIVIPRLMEKAEVIVNITRNIFLKLYGNIFFNEQILSLEFYKRHSQEKNAIYTSIPEILDLVNEFNFPSEHLEAHCKSFAKSYKINLKQHANDIQKQLIIEWKRKWKNKLLSLDEKQTIETIFKEFLKKFKQTPESFYKHLSKRIKILNSEIHFILPHEMSAYNDFEENRYIHYIRAIKNKLEEINSLSEFIEGIDSLIKNNPKEDELKILGILINSRMKEMRKEKKVLKFNIPENNKNQDLKHLKRISPLFLIKIFPKGTPMRNWSKEVVRLGKNYDNSIYTKIYLSLLNFNRWILKNQELNNKKFTDSEENKNLKKILPSLTFRKNSLKVLQSNLGLLIDLSENINFKDKNINKRHYVPIDDLRKAWSYFCSSVLTLLYYEKFSNYDTLPKGFKSDKFLNSILNFIEKKCLQGINHFHIVKLFWILYEKEKNDGLKFVIYCINKPQNILRYILYQLMIPEIGSNNMNNRLEKLKKFSDALISVYKKRFKKK